MQISPADGAHKERRARVLLKDVVKGILGWLVDVVRAPLGWGHDRSLRCARRRVW